MAMRLSIVSADYLLPPGRFLVPISVTDRVDPMTIVRLEGLGQLKNLMTSLGIKPVTFQLVTASQEMTLPHVPHTNILETEN
jgi:hypothetical protein